MARTAVIAHGRLRTTRSAHAIARMVTHLSAHGGDVSLTFTHSAEEGTHAAVQAARDADLVVAVGGDGTVHSVLQGLVDAPSTLAIAYAGSGNDGARFIGHPSLHDPRLLAWLDRTLDLITGDSAHAEREEQRIDVALARCADGSAAFFLTVLSSGFDALVNDRAHRLRRIPARIRYVAATILELPRCVGRRYTLSFPDDMQAHRAVLVAAGNGGVYGGGMRICPAASVRDGLLDLTIITEISRTTLLRLFPQVFTGRHVSDPRVITQVTRSVEISGPALDCFVDGERLGPLPVRVDVRPRALRVAPALMP